MPEWTHPVCGYCWDEKHGKQEPMRLTSPVLEMCCYCGYPTYSGIYVRANPVDLLCQGIHETK